MNFISEEMPKCYDFILVCVVFLGSLVLFLENLVETAQGICSD